ncbi:hypothetical protein O4H52_01110 [Sphingomonadaceae bacterium G21617-S1]|nr:hypothetical protein [Sphingomonadaceae bacterium G21617-S1]
MRHLAWLGAVPRDTSADQERDHQALRREQRKPAPKPKPKSRQEQMEDDGVLIELPPNPAPFIIERLMEVGPAMGGGMERAPITFTEIENWQASTWSRLMPWESRLLRRLSVAFVAETHRAEEPDCPPPWIDEVEEPQLDRAKIERNIRSALAAFRGPPAE